MGAFLRAELVGNVFWTRLTASFEDSTLSDINSENEVQAKIDTGCYDSHISYDTMFLSFEVIVKSLKTGILQFCMESRNQ